MSELNHDIPEMEVLVRNSFLHNGEGAGYEPAVWFGISSNPGFALGCHVLLANGAMFWRLPLHALCWKESIERPLTDLQLWDCFSSDVSVHEFKFLSKTRVSMRTPGDKWLHGHYQFTVDWWGSPGADGAGAIGHKCGHLIRLDEGNFALQPNNRMIWGEPAWVTRPFPLKPTYKTNTKVWRVESRDKTTEDSDRYFYLDKDK